MFSFFFVWGGVRSDPHPFVTPLNNANAFLGALDHPSWARARRARHILVQTTLAPAPSVATTLVLKIRFPMRCCACRRQGGRNGVHTLVGAYSTGESVQGQLKIQLPGNWFLSGAYPPAYTSHFAPVMRGRNGGYKLGQYYPTEKSVPGQLRIQLPLD